MMNDRQQVLLAQRGKPYLMDPREWAASGILELLRRRHCRVTLEQGHVTVTGAARAILTLDFEIALLLATNLHLRMRYLEQRWAFILALAGRDDPQGLVRQWPL